MRRPSDPHDDDAQRLALAAEIAGIASTLGFMRERLMALRGVDGDSADEMRTGIDLAWLGATRFRVELAVPLADLNAPYQDEGEAVGLD